MACHQEATAIHAVPALGLERGFRVLVLREMRMDGAPPAFAVIEQQLLRGPERQNRHGVSFAIAFRPEIMDWLIADLGRPSQRSAAGETVRNRRWPSLRWHGEDRLWAEGIRTIEWFADVVFQDDASLAAFAERWRGRLEGEIDGAGI